MSGATLKWYLRHLQDGKSPEEAFRLATSRSRGSNPSPAAKKHANAASVAGRGNQTFSRGNATQPGKQGCGKAEPRNATEQSAKRKSGQITPQEPPSSKRQKGNQPPAIGGQRPAPNPNPGDGGQRKYSEALKGIRMAVLPRNYPAEVLGPEELTALQDSIMDEVYNGCGYTGSFHGVYFRSGMLLVDCKDERTTTWLAEIAPKLNGWRGPVLCAKRGEDIPPMHCMTVFLPRSAGKPYEFALGLIRNQNDGLGTSAWRVVDSNIEDAGWRLNITIDDESYKFIRKEGFRLNFRFSSVVMRPWRPKTTPAEGTAEEAMVVDEAPTQSSTGTLGQVATATVVQDATDAAEGAPNICAKECEGELPSTQELLEGLKEQDQQGNNKDSDDDDLSLLEPVL
ncbi:uncharacterized protein [Bactrocera oleae]|uniref:uncharacterized protein n=1 Tax=Bactrocera oleae TaxID=104688 RepID=UPI00387EA4BC